MQTLLQRFRSGETGLDDVFGFQRRDFPAWGNPPGRFLNFFRTFGLDIDRIALANVAWCATNDNHYPRWMLNTCMRRLTGRLIDRLKPDVVMLSGSSGRHPRRSEASRAERPHFPDTALRSSQSPGGRIAKPGSFVRSWRLSNQENSPRSAAHQFIIDHKECLF